MGMLFAGYSVQVFVNDPGFLGLAVLFQGRKIITFLTYDCSRVQLRCFQS